MFDVTATSPALGVRLLRDGVIVATRLGTGPLADPGIVPDGTHLYATDQVDGGGIVGPPGPSISITVMTRPPVTTAAPGLPLGDDSGMSGDGITAVNPPHLVGSTAPNATVQVVSAGGMVIASGTSTGAGAYSILLPTFASDGTYSLQIRATDVAGNVGSAGPAFLLTIDTTPPAAPSVLAIAAGDDSGKGGDGLTNVTSPHLIGTAEPGSTVQLVGPGGVIGSTVASSAGSFSVAPTSALADGPIVVQARAIDAAGNVGPARPGLHADDRHDRAARPRAPDPAEGRRLGHVRGQFDRRPVAAPHRHDRARGDGRAARRGAGRRSRPSSPTPPGRIRSHHRNRCPSARIGSG